MNKSVITIGILVVAGYVNPARGQPAATLYIELQNVVEYQVDTSDFSKFGTDPNVTPGKLDKGLGCYGVGIPIIGFGDIVSVNGQPARGTYAVRGVTVCLSQNSHSWCERNRRYELAFDARRDVRDPAKRRYYPSRNYYDLRIE